MTFRELPNMEGDPPIKSVQNMDPSAASELLKRYARDFEGAISAPSRLAFSLYERDVIPYTVYNVSIGVKTGLSTAKKAAKIIDAALESVASSPLLLVDLVQASENHSEEMGSVCSRIRMEPLYG